MYVASNQLRAESLGQLLMWLLCHYCWQRVEEEVGEHPGWEELFLFWHIWRNFRIFHCALSEEWLPHTTDIASGNFHMTKSPTFLSLVSQCKTSARCPSFNPILSFLLPHFPTSRCHFTTTHAWDLTSHHTEKQPMLCSPSPPFRAKWRLTQVECHGSTLRAPRAKGWEQGSLPLPCYPGGRQLLLARAGWGVNSALGFERT